MTPRGPILAAALAVFACAGCASAGGAASAPAAAGPAAARADDPVEVAVEGTWRHEPSGMDFPERIGAFVREKVVRYDEEGRDVGVGYVATIGANGIAATVYVHPSRGGARAEARETAASILRLARPGGRRVSEEEVRVVNGGSTHEGVRATFTLEDPLAAKGPRTTSLLYTFSPGSGTWTVAYRFNFPLGAGDAGAVATLLRDLPWPK
jgi:hypothetical protein